MEAHHSITVRAATVADADAMGRIHAAAWKTAYVDVMPRPFLDGLDPTVSADRWRAVLSGEVAPPEGIRVEVLVAEIDGEVVAMTSFGDGRDTGPDDPTGELWMLNAHPDAFGTGAAAALDDEVARRLATDHERAFLWVVDDNPRARRFYERQGWRPDGVHKVQEIGGAEIAEVRLVRDLIP